MISLIQANLRDFVFWSLNDQICQMIGRLHVYYIFFAKIALFWPKLGFVNFSP